jgi:hypothetical protein
MKIITPPDASGGGGCFAGTVLPTVGVNLLHYPLNPHLPGQNLPAVVFRLSQALQCEV